MAQKVVYISSTHLRTQCDKIEVIKNRSQMVHSLIRAYNLLSDPKVTVKHPRRIAPSELLDFHSSDYVKYLKSLPTVDSSFNNSSFLSDTSDAAITDDDLEFGIGYDCPKIDNLLEFCLSLASGTISAAEAILTKEADIAINWCGGWHHAQRDSAAGFCYVNDIVLGIERLKERFKRILYVDLDVHHGDGVEQAFYSTQKVLTLSFHVLEPGYFPGSGSIEANGIGNGKGFSINAPFKFNIGSQYIDYFCDIFDAVTESYQPEVFVVQCGADILAGDPLGSANLQISDMMTCVERILSKNGPKIFLGGGGYDPISASKYWTSLTGLILGRELNEDVPDHEFFLKYGPCYTLNLDRKQLKDFNDKEELMENMKKIHECLEKYVKSKKVS
ncbi:histone deacetylase 8-like [Culicoides brevitarsis]|uniref:histone deacetylase 8-like n=1 Tax=Culicoides brevitarsis TaxID=469753 RepID=UPI00307B9743